ncbi:MAG: hypothetical protein GXN92_00150 [Candidatus Micrarchaeota archaeon]|nr:hypothetical protein [Candidatus Micrarchaeota archaeon]
MHIILRYTKDPEHVYYALKALKPDPRAPFSLRLEENVLVVEIEAQDSVAARRILNSILRITSTIERLPPSF